MIAPANPPLPIRAPDIEDWPLSDEAAEAVAALLLAAVDREEGESLDDHQCTE